MSPLADQLECSAISASSSEVIRRQESTYWSFDQRLKRWQSDAGSVTSATGAIYAMRRHLFKPLPSGVSDDAMNSYHVVASGYRVVFEPEAVAYETVAPSGQLELKREVRVCVRGIHGIAAMSGSLIRFVSASTPYNCYRISCFVG